MTSLTHEKTRQDNMNTVCKIVFMVFLGLTIISAGEKCLYLLIQSNPQIVSSVLTSSRVRWGIRGDFLNTYILILQPVKTLQIGGFN